MISFTRKPAPQPSSTEAEDNRFEQIRKAAAERHKKSDADGTRRSERQKPNRLI